MINLVKKTTKYIKFILIYGIVGMFREICVKE